MTAMPANESTLVLRVQTVLFGHELRQIWRLLRGLDAAARKAIDAGLVGRVEWALGDSAANPSLGPEDVLALNDASTDAFSAVTYEFFGENLGSSGGRIVSPMDTRAIYCLSSTLTHTHLRQRWWSS